MCRFAADLIGNDQAGQLLTPHSLLNYPYIIHRKLFLSLYFFVIIHKPHDYK